MFLEIAGIVRLFHGDGFCGGNDETEQILDFFVLRNAVGGMF